MTKIRYFFSTIWGTFLIVAGLSYAGIAFLWTIVEVFAFFKEDTVKAFFGDLWFLIFLLPIAFAIIAVFIRFIKNKITRKVYDESKDNTEEFSLEVTDVYVQSSIYSKCIPKESLEFNIIMDAVNRSEEEAIIRSIEIIDFVTGIDILDIDSPKINLGLRNFPHATQDIHLPHPFDKKKRIPDLQLKITTSLKKLSRLKFAEYLKNFENYSIKLSYTYDNLEHTGIKKIIQIEGSFESFKANLIKEWRQNSNCHDLAVVANITSIGNQSDLVLKDKSPEVEIKNWGFINQ